jgi:hypothetical protein
MALDPTSREANIRDSVKKFLVDSLYTTEGINLFFDIGLATPRLQGQPIEADRWVVINFGSLEIGVMSEFQIDVVCCTRKDNEGFRLAQLRDTVFGYLTDNTQIDGVRRIVFYTSYEHPTPWVVIGGIMIMEIIESRQMPAEDGTKYKILTCNLRFASKV